MILTTRNILINKTNDDYIYNTNTYTETIRIRKRWERGGGSGVRGRVVRDH